MSENDTNSDRTTVETEGTGERQARGFEMPDCCRPMVERMMKAFGSTPGNETGAHDGPPASDLPDWCTSMMAEMMKACGEPRKRNGESAEEKPESCCGEPA